MNVISCGSFTQPSRVIHTLAACHNTKKLNLPSDIQTLFRLAWFDINWSEWPWEKRHIIPAAFWGRTISFKGGALIPTEAQAWLIKPGQGQEGWERALWGSIALELEGYLAKSLFPMYLSAMRYGCNCGCDDTMCFVSFQFRRAGETEKNVLTFVQ